MDINNNSVGRYVYQQTKGKSIQDIYLGVVDAAASGLLVTYNQKTKTVENFKLNIVEKTVLKNLNVNDYIKK